MSTDTTPVPNAMLAALAEDIEDLGRLLASARDGGLLPPDHKLLDFRGSRWPAGREVLSLAPRETGWRAMVDEIAAALDIPRHEAHERVLLATAHIMHQYPQARPIYADTGRDYGTVFAPRAAVLIRRLIHDDENEEG